MRDEHGLPPVFLRHGYLPVAALGVERRNDPRRSDLDQRDADQDRMVEDHFHAKSGYWQIPVAEEDRWLTAFVTHDGLYEWIRMPFGLKNVGATFVRAVRSVLTPICDFSELYVDDIGVGSDAWSQHLHHIRRFLGIIKEVGMTLSLEKCEFAKPEVKFVVHFVGSGGRYRLLGF